ncbi:Protein-ribulosamine 3-kinase, chloroplastic [Dendrobium catenatum]|uniref:Protein-ribulosamine 3-kinase, chloroplastic n=1 Tax=Dendrobium catenatum TaxID=906689 RepID=A0A2I0X6R9_9ASPA|nr:Protein-ribulosamine 3-kinase, chloroplastic [Dendrobium catenatum]
MISALRFRWTVLFWSVELPNSIWFSSSAPSPPIQRRGMECIKLGSQIRVLGLMLIIPLADWIEFFSEHRLGYQLKIALKRFGDCEI